MSSFKKKSISLFFLLLLLAAGMTSCGKRKEPVVLPELPDAPNSYAEDTPATPVEPTPTEETPEKEENPYAEALEKEFPSYGLSGIDYTDLQGMLTLADAFSYYPQTFSNPSELSNACLFFTTTAVLSDSFQLSSDGFAKTLSFDTLLSAIPSVFGPSAQLQSGWENEDYSPYQLDLEKKEVLTFGQGSVSTFFFPWAVVPLEDGTYQLWLLDLMDPLFSEQPENEALLEAGNASSVPIDAVKDIARQMQTNVYTFQKSESGLHLIGFEYRNYKNIEIFRG